MNIEMPSFHLFAESCKYHGDVLDCLTLNLFLSDNSILGVEHHKSGLQETNVQENKHVHVDLIKNPSYYCENDTSTVCCCLLGIPQEFNLKNINDFIEPYANDILSVTIIKESGKHGTSTQTAVIIFTESSWLLSFCKVYNDLHFPIESDYAPCIVLPLQQFLCDLDLDPESTGENTEEALNPKGVNCVSDDMQQQGGLLLPHCTVCIRRVQEQACQFPFKSRMPVDKSYNGNELRCYVCRLFTDETQEDRKCLSCGLRQNVWICLSCGHGGCGRYTYQHAQDHYRSTKHPFSLELVTGRIWDYFHDSFIHHETVDLNGLNYSPHATDVDIRSSPTLAWPIGDQLSQLPFPDGAVSISPVLVSQKAYYPSKYNTSLSTNPQSYFSTRSNDTTSANSGATALDDITTQKIGNVVAYYESLLRSQLADQSLHYEKLLARETVKLLENEFGALTSCDIRFLSESICESDTKDEKTMAGDINSSKIAGDEVASAEGDMSMRTIENLKIEISVLEEDYRNILLKIRSSEESIRKRRSENSKLCEKQKAMQQRISALNQLALDTNKRRLDQIAELNEQIRDMDFFLRTQSSVEASDIKDDIQQGSVLVIPGSSQDNKTRKVKGKRKK